MRLVLYVNNGELVKAATPDEVGELSVIVDYDGSEGLIHDELPMTKISEQKWADYRELMDLTEMFDEIRDRLKRENR